MYAILVEISYVGIEGYLRRKVRERNIFNFEAALVYL